MARRLAIGDIHGCLNALLTLVDYVGIGDEDELITLGDYVDRGPDSRGVIDWLIQRRERGPLVALRGNHDVMMLQARQRQIDLPYWLGVGGAQTLQSYASEVSLADGHPPRLGGLMPRLAESGAEVGADSTGAAALAAVPESHWHFLDEVCQRFHEAEQHFFVHGNVFPKLPLPNQPDMVLYWHRFGPGEPHVSGKAMVCGHTAQRSGLPNSAEYAVCIDTWVYGPGYLTCLDIDTSEYWQASESGHTRRGTLDPPLQPPS